MSKCIDEMSDITHRERAQDLGEETCVSRFCSCFCVSPTNSSSSYIVPGNWTSALTLRSSSIPPAHLHLLWICSGSERSGQLDRINTTAALRESLFNWSDFMGRAFSLKRFKDLQVVVLLFLSALGDNVLKQTLAFALRFKWAHTGEPLGTQARN